MSIKHLNDFPYRVDLYYNNDDVMAAWSLIIKDNDLKRNVDFDIYIERNVIGFKDKEMATLVKLNL